MNKSQVTPIFRFEVIENDVCIGHAQAIDNPIIRCDADADVKLSLSGNFVLDISPPNWLKVSLKPYLILDGAESPLGEYLITQADKCINRKGVLFWRIKGMDLGRIVQRSRTEERVIFFPGQRYTDIIQNTLLELGLSRIIAVQSDAVLANARADWEIGTSWIKIINSLLEEINYQSLWFDADGNARVEPQKPIDGSIIDHEYKVGEFSKIKMAAENSSDIYKAYNVFTAMVSSPEYEEPLIATAINDSPTSRISTVNIGRVQAPIKRIDDIASQKELQKYVDNLKFRSMCSNEIFSFRTALNQHQVGDIIAVQHPLADGIYQETEWKMVLGFDGEMTHTVQRIVIE